MLNYYNDFDTVAGTGKIFETVIDMSNNNFLLHSILAPKESNLFLDEYKQQCARSYIIIDYIENGRRISEEGCDNDAFLFIKVSKKIKELNFNLSPYDSLLDYDSLTDN